MKLIDDIGNEWEIKQPDCPAPWWLWRDVWTGLLIAFIVAHLTFI